MIRAFCKVIAFIKWKELKVITYMDALYSLPFAWFDKWLHGLVSPNEVVLLAGQVYKRLSAYRWWIWCWENRQKSSEEIQLLNPKPSHGSHPKLRLVSLIKIQLRHQMGSYEEKKTSYFFLLPLLTLQSFIHFCIKYSKTESNTIAHEFCIECVEVKKEAY